MKSNKIKSHMKTSETFFDKIIKIVTLQLVSEK